MKIILILLTSVWSLSMNAQNVNIPDTNFKNILLEDSVDINNDGEIQVNEALLVKHLYVINKNISSLKGIDAFKNLTALDCSLNNLTELDVSENTKILSLRCNNNKITNLDLSKNSTLTYVRCSHNLMTKIYVPDKINTSLWSKDPTAEWIKK